MSVFDWPGKSAPEGGIEHPVFWHMLDVGAVAEALLAPLDLPEGRKPALALAAALHDLGKISDSFCAMLREGRPQTHGRHWEVTEVWLNDFDAGLGCLGEDAADRRDVYAAIAGHHGRPPRSESFRKMRAAAGPHAASDAKAALEICLSLWPNARLDIPYTQVPSLSWWLPGLIAASDWIGSNPAFFPAQVPGMKPEAYLEQSRRRAREALHLAGLDIPALSGLPLLPESWTLRPMQRAAGQIDLPDGPTLALIEDETGSGKTEAALILAQRMMLSGKGAGLFFALPTMATATAMFDRTAELVARLYLSAPSLALAHGRATLSDRFRALIRPDRSPTLPACTEWLADDRRRALLANIGVGTVDQALFSALPVRHAMLRHYALSSKILIVDEIHEMGDPYMIEEVVALLTLHRRMGGSAILMTATLPLSLRARLFEAWDEAAPASADYPTLTVAGQPPVTELASVSSRGPVAIERLGCAENAVEILVRAATDGAAAVWVRNAVDDAIAGVDALRARGVEADLLHARFALCDRLQHEAGALARFGKTREDRPGRVLVATQVVESSLDLDFDVMVSDLAPVPAIVQRAGRLWRHMDLRPAQGRPRPAPILHLLSPDPDQAEDDSWLRSVLDRGAWTYPLDLQWHAAKALLAAGRIDAPSGLRALIEAGLEAGALPPALSRSQEERIGKGYSHGALARQNLIDLTRPYREQLGFADDADFPTRLGVPQRVLVLAGSEEGGLVPWSGGNWNVDSRQRSEVSATAHRLDALPLPDQTAPAIAAVKAEWPESLRDKLVLCPVGSDGAICEGLAYDAARGLIFLSQPS